MFMQASLFMEFKATCAELELLASDPAVSALGARGTSIFYTPQQPLYNCILGHVETDPLQRHDHAVCV
jgi:hypothetical protein